MIYWLVPGAISISSPEFSDCLYFSVVTITTLGYGEIQPINDVGKFFASLEAIFGIIIIGVFLNSLWQSFSEKIEATQKEVIANETERKNIHEIQGYYQYLNVVLKDFDLSLLEMTTPIGRDYADEPNPNFHFSGMKDIFKQSLLLKHGFSKSAVEIYFDKQDVLFDELKEFLANHDLHLLPNLRKSIVEFLKVTRQLDVREGLYSIREMRAGTISFKDEVEKLIEENETCPDVEQYQSHILTPVILFYNNLKSQILITQEIKREFEKVAVDK